MPQIALLPPNLINQIAAGEVIERPASVVKELVENSLDAGAQKIEVVLQKAGREMICVTDNGSGMDETDARMCLMRHATSKIRSFDDLTQVGTMGFRGEALPSIASIGYLTLKTRTASAAHAFELRIEGGKKISEGPASGSGTPSGTSITVEHLFYNVPARRKFLKSDVTELSHSVELLKSLALANPHVGFKLSDVKRTIINLPEKQTAAERLRAIFGTETLALLQPIEAHSGRMVLTGFLSPLGVSFPTRSKIAFFINRRPVDSKIFHQAMREAYGNNGSSMTRGAYPAAFLFLTLDPGEIDVNVHPAKREVRFRAEREKLIFLVQALAQALQGQRTAAFHPRETPPFNSTSHANSFSTPFAPQQNLSSHAGDFQKNSPLPRSISDISAFATPPSASFPAASVQTQFAVAESNTPGHRWQFLSFLGIGGAGDFVLFSTPEGLTLMCIAHAQERVAYEKIENIFSAGAVRSQALLIPALLQLEGPLEETLKSNETFIAQQGFVAAPFGSGTWRLEAVPGWLSAENGFAGAPERLFIAELSALMENESTDERLKHRHFAQLAATHARTRLLHPEAARRLADELLATKNPLKSPTGEPTVWLISAQELQKRFGL